MTSVRYDTPLASNAIPRWWNIKAMPTAVLLMHQLQHMRSCGADEDDHLDARRKRRGPCAIPGCNGGPYVKDGKVQWYAAPRPSPWANVPPGASICTRHYSTACTIRKRAAAHGGLRTFLRDAPAIDGRQTPDGRHEQPPVAAACRCYCDAVSDTTESCLFCGAVFANSDTARRKRDKFACFAQLQSSQYVDLTQRSQVSAKQDEAHSEVTADANADEATAGPSSGQAPPAAA